MSSRNLGASRLLAPAVSMFLGLVLLGAAVGTPETGGQQGASWKVDVPFEFLKKQVLVEVEVNGAGPFNMLLDTGADPSAMDIAAAKRASLPVDTERHGFAEGVGDDDVPIYPLTLRRVAIGGHDFGDIEGLALDLSAIAVQLGRRLDGVLGISFLAERVVQIDYPARRVRIAPSASALGTLQGNAHLEMPLEFVPGDTIPRLSQLLVNGEPLQVSLDTGSSLTIELFADGIRQLGLEGSVGGEEVTVVGARGESRVIKALLRSVRLGPFDLGEVEARLAPARSHEGRSGNLGNGLLSRFILTLDYSERRITLEKPTEGSVATEGDSAG